MLAAIAWAPRQQADAVPAIATPQQLSTSFRTVAADVLPSVVSIRSVTKARQVEVRGEPQEEMDFPFPELFRSNPELREFFRDRGRGGSGPRQMPRREGQGSGFVIDAKGLIMTNNHVVEDADEVIVRLNDGREFTAVDIKTDKRTDVAVLRIEGATDLKAVRLGDSNAVEVGDWVLAFGAPFGLESTVTQGIISAKGRNDRQILDREDFLQTDAAINPGNSGGPLVNLQGEVIGINTAIASRSGGYDGIGFAIPMTMAEWVGTQLATRGTVQRAYLGTQIAPVESPVAKQFNVSEKQGAVLTEIFTDSPADKAALEPGDVIVNLNNTAIRNPQDLVATVERLEIGKAYPIEIVRGGNRQTLQITLEAMPEDYTRQYATRLKQKGLGELGLKVQTLTPDVARGLGLNGAIQGVVVEGVAEKSPAANAGIEVGDVIEKVGNRPVTSAQEFQAALKNVSLKDGVALHLRNAAGRKLIVLRSPAE